jgi:hypothetical protein
MAATFIDGGNGFSQSSFARAWYDMVHHETDHSGRAFNVGNIRTVGAGSRGMSLQSLLEVIWHTSPAPQHILMVHHGRPDALHIPIWPGGNPRQNRQAATRENLGLLSGRYYLDAGGRAYRITALSGGQRASDAQLATHFSKRGSDVANLRHLMSDVQGMPIQRIDIRACNIGNNAETLQEIGHFFGVRAVCAPTMYDEFGYFQIEVVNTAQATRRQQRVRWIPYMHQQVIQVWLRRQGGGVRGMSVDSAPYPIISSFIQNHFTAGGVFHPTRVHLNQVTNIRQQGIRYHGFSGALSTGGSTYQNAVIFPGMSQYTSSLVNAPIT